MRARVKQRNLYVRRAIKAIVGVVADGKLDVYLLLIW